MDRLVTLEGGRHEARMESEAVIHGKIQEEMIDSITNIVIIQELSRKLGPCVTGLWGEERVRLYVQDWEHLCLQWGACL